MDLKEVQRRGREIIKDQCDIDEKMSKLWADISSDMALCADSAANAASAVKL